jgi:hypothetical protein
MVTVLEDTERAVDLGPPLREEVKFVNADQLCAIAASNLYADSPALRGGERPASF